MRILQLEDDMARAQAVEGTLRAAGFACETVVPDGRAMHRARQNDYDVILLNMGRANALRYDILKHLERARVRASVLVNFAGDDGDHGRAAMEVADRLARSNGAGSNGDASNGDASAEVSVSGTRAGSPAPAPAASEGEKRRLPRAKIIKSGQIVFDDNKCLSECLILDMSSGGAALQPSDTLNFPNQFQLRFKLGPTYDCEVCWKRGRKIGVRFLNDPEA
jgi:CheY-like chemotaxis protein